MTDSLPRICELLQSEASSDVVEALRFFSHAVNFGLKGSARYFTSTFSLIWHPDSEIQSEVISAFRNVYLTDGSLIDPRPLPPSEIATNVCSLLSRCADTERASLEKIISALFEKQDETFDSEVVDCLWNTLRTYHSLLHAPDTQNKNVTQDRNPTLLKNRRSSLSFALNCSSKVQALRSHQDLGPTLMVLAMVSRCRPLLTADKLLLLSETAFHEAVFLAQDLETLRSACVLLQTMPSFLSLQGGGGGSSSLNANSNSNSISYSNQPEALRMGVRRAVKGLCEVALGQFCDDNETLTKAWFGICEEAMVALFHLSPHADVIVSKIIPKAYASLCGLGTSACSPFNCTAAGLSRFLFLLGQTSLCTLLSTENLAKASKQRQIHDLKNKEMEEKSKKILSSSSEVAKSSKSTKEKFKKGKLTKEEPIALESDSIEEEMGIQAAMDAEADKIYNHIVDTQIVAENLLSSFVPLIAFILANEHQAFSDPLLRQTSALALVRIMSISPLTCEKYLPLIFTTLTNDPSPSLQATLMVGLGDLVLRFPNLLEPWTHHIYAKLSHPDLHVRHNTLLTLTHLILNDMVKVKGQVVHIVCCLTDTHPPIRALATLFFQRLSERAQNPLLNLLGDIIGTLSTANNNSSSSAKISSSTPSQSNSDSTVVESFPLALPLPPIEPTPSHVMDSLDSLERDLNLDTDAEQGGGGGGGVARLTHPGGVAGGMVAPRSLTVREFKESMSFLLSLLKKDKQADSLLERLLMRLAAARGRRERISLALCIAELNISEKGIKKILENFKSIKESLYDPQVREAVKTAVLKARKSRSTPVSAGAGEGEGAGEDQNKQGKNKDKEGGVGAGGGGGAREGKALFDELEDLLKGVERAAMGVSEKNDVEGDGDGDDGVGVGVGHHLGELEMEIGDEGGWGVAAFEKKIKVKDEKENMRGVESKKGKGNKNGNGNGDGKKVSLATKASGVRGKKSKKNKHDSSEEDNESSDSDEEVQEEASPTSSPPPPTSARNRLIKKETLSRSRPVLAAKRAQKTNNRNNNRSDFASGSDEELNLSSNEL